jgi:hypothetical protein
MSNIRISLTEQEALLIRKALCSLPVNGPDFKGANKLNTKIHEATRIYYLTQRNAGRPVASQEAQEFYGCPS